MKPPKNIRIAALGVMLVVLAAAGAAMAATKLHHGSHQAAIAAGSFVSSSSKGMGPRFGGRGHDGPGDLQTAATYLGTTVDALRAQLESGKTLAQIADATSGKSKDGLIDALVTAAKAHIQADVTAGRLTQAQADQLIAGLKDHITQFVTHTGPPHGGFGHGGDDLQSAANYLGLSPTDLQTQLRAGKTLGQIADATSGKSKDGLIAALVADEKTELAQKVKDGELTQAQADQITASLQQRFTDMVNGTFPDRHGHDGPPPPGAPGPSNGMRHI